ncbi:hypothetical protein LJR030_001338 [Rhizobium sp. LjRoot30]|uniref:hypothetical protein n=1 Tax=Rhizobium sp. LjRoot30 TaxID=3342320 RepID=UPI003ECD5BC0
MTNTLFRVVGALHDGSANLNRKRAWLRCALRAALAAVPGFALRAAPFSAFPVNAGSTEMLQRLVLPHCPTAKRFRFGWKCSSFGTAIPAGGKV